MRAGNLRTLLTLQEKTVTSQDSYGQDVYTWTDVDDYWCDVRSLQGRELEAVSQRWTDARFKITARYSADFTTVRRWKWGTRYLDIVDVEDPDQRQRISIMFCREVK